MKPCFCLYCNEMVEPVIKETMSSICYKGEIFTDFPEAYAICPTCWEGFIVPEAHDVNLRKLQELYAERMKEKKIDLL